MPKNQETWDTIKSIMGEILDIDEAALEARARRATNFGGEAHPLVREKRNKVLIVEDDADLARALERRLKKCGAETLIASNGIEAYRMATKELPDAIIADYVMPEGGGHYLLWRLKSTESTKHIPVIMITGQRFEAGTEHSLGRETTGRSGAVKLFHKPLDTDALFKRARAALRRSSTSRASESRRIEDKGRGDSPRPFLSAMAIRQDVSWSPRSAMAKSSEVRSMSLPTLIGRPKQIALPDIAAEPDQRIAVGRGLDPLRDAARAGRARELDDALADAGVHRSRSRSSAHSSGRA